MKAVIIAAGQGSRLFELHKGFPKSLLKINGKRMIDDILEKLQQAGLTEVALITGYKSQMIEQHLSQRRPAGLTIEFIYNPQWQLANGISVLQAKQATSKNEPFLLLMSDHIFDISLLQKMINVKLGQHECCVGLDFKIDQIFDLPDGMKVQCRPDDPPLHNILKLDKNLTEFDAIDCGMFKCDHHIFTTLEQAAEKGDNSLGDACNLLCQQDLMKGLDIGESFWIDLDTPEAFAFYQQKTGLVGNE